MKQNELLNNLRHSTAHLLAQAVIQLYPGTKTTIGPTIENGFFYDFLPPKNFKKEDLPKIEEKMHELSKLDYKIIGKQVSKKEAKEFFKDNEFKLELIDSITDEMVGIFCQGDFCDLCRGGHVESTGKIKHFKLTSVAGSYWRADKNKSPLQRIYGVAFESSKDLRIYLKQVEDAKKYDHRKLGKQLDLFSFNEVAAGFPFFHNKGLVIYNKLTEYMRFLQKGDYQEVKTPIIMQEGLWKTSGHYDHYKENMYFTTIDEKVCCVKPMNCPGGILLYKEKPHSYREFPLRVSEFGLVHRHELSGVLHGLFRVRAFTQDDAHVYCTVDQAESEIVKIIELAQNLYNKFEFKKVKMFLATKPKKAMGSDELWQKATSALRNALEQKGIDYEVDEGGGAFYGPKIDMVIEDAMGREWQCGTVQFDFFMPQNFKLEYIKSDQSKEAPIMVHRAIYGSLERFLGILVEHYKGRFPFWLSPVQAKILTITDNQKEYAKKIYKKLFDAGIRVELDESGDQISAQIRNAQIKEVPWMLVIGKKEQEKETVSLRTLDGKQEFDFVVEDLLKKAEELNKY
ncbi:threonine--tRNA ligase [Candidatus Dependentiae bacterium]